MLIGQIIDKTEVEGPGSRAALWLQGCTINCHNCCNPSFLPKEGGSYYNPEELAENFSKLQAIEGITILGGEPLQQKEGLKTFLTKIKELSSLSIMLFTGYQWEQILADKTKLELVLLCDLVIAGPFLEKEAPDVRRWIGSKNQTIHFITDRYKNLKDNWPITKKEIEIRIREDEIIINGSPLTF